MKQLDLVIREYISIVEYLHKKLSLNNGTIMINSKSFYALLDSNLYIKRSEKLDIYKQLNFIVCNSNGSTSVVYDKQAKKACRKIIVNYETYRIIKRLFETELVL